MSVQNETMQHLIAFNGFRGGNKGSACCQPLSEYDKTISLPWLHEMVLQIRGEKSIRSVDRADEAKIAKAQQRIKGQLPFRCAHYYRFLKNRRAQDNADPTAFLFQTTVDVDDKEYVEQAIERARELNCSDTIWKGMLLHLEYSARKKLHIDIRMPVGMTIEETQRAYCEALGVPYDESCISPERMIYITDKDSEIYRSKEWYGVLPAEEISLRREAFVKRGLTIDGRASSSGSSSSGSFSPGFSSSELRGKNGTLAALSEGYSPQNLNGTLAALGGGSGSADADGCSTDTRTQGASQWPQGQIRLNSVRNPGSKNVPIPPCNPMKKNDEENPMNGNPMNENSASEKNLIAFELFKEAAGLSGMDIDTVGSRHSSLLAIMSAGASRVMSEEELMKVVAKKMPSYYEERDCHQLIHDFYAKYGDSSKPFSRDVIRINATAEKAASGLVGGTVMGDAAYQLAGNHKVQSSKFNAQSNDDDEYPAPPPMPKKLPKLVELLVSQTPDIYKPAVAQGHFLYTSLNEIDQFDALKGIGNQHFRIMCLAFDPGNEYGQTRVGLQSVTERVTIRFNWNASTTIEKGKRYFSKVLTDGPISRINFCTIPERLIGEDIPIYGNYDDEFRAQLRPYIENLCKASGLVDCPEAFSLAMKLKDENAEFSRLSQNRIYENFTFRGNVIGYLKACVLYVANGFRWEPEIEEFIRWSEQYDLYCKMRFFEDGIKTASTSADGTKNMLYAWAHRGYIERRKAGNQGGASGGTSGGTPDGSYSSYSSYSSDCFIKLKFRKDGGIES